MTLSDAEAFLDATAGQPMTGGCLLLEADLPGLSSLMLVQRLRAEGSQLPVIFLVSTSNRDIADQARQVGAVDIINKPLTNGQLIDRLQRLL